MTPDPATARDIVTVGPPIGAWEQRDGSTGTQVAFVDPRTDDERRAQDDLAARIDDGLRAGGFTEQLETWRLNVLPSALDPALPQDLSDDMLRYVGFGAPVAIFVVAPAEVGP